jgi:hypothetical protein
MVKPASWARNRKERPNQHFGTRMQNQTQRLSAVKPASWATMANHPSCIIRTRLSRKIIKTHKNSLFYLFLKLMSLKKK